MLRHVGQGSSRIVPQQNRSRAHRSENAGHRRNSISVATGAKPPDIPVVVMTAFAAWKRPSRHPSRAYDILTKPIEMELLAMILGRAVERRRLQQQVRQLSEAFDSPPVSRALEKASMKRLYGSISRVADSEATVLITGESGTGKNWWPRRCISDAATGEAVCRRELRRAARCAAGKRTVRPHERRIHRMPRRAQGLFLQAEGERSCWTKSARCRFRCSQSFCGPWKKIRCGRSAGIVKSNSTSEFSRDQPRFGDVPSRKEDPAGPVFPRQRHSTRRPALRSRELIRCCSRNISSRPSSPDRKSR